MSDEGGSSADPAEALTRTAPGIDVAAGFSALFDHSAIGHAFVDDAGQIIAANPAMGELLGYGTAELVGRSMVEQLAPADRARRHRGAGPDQWPPRARPRTLRAGAPP